MKDTSAKNKFCRASDLSNEASVESFFVLRLLKDLGYRDDEIRTKKAIDSLKIPKGRAKESFKPDYIIVCGGRPRWLLDAKPTTDKIEDWTHQCAGYALQINRKYSDRPLVYYVLSNGLLTRVYRWDQEEAVLSLRFGDLADGNPKYEALKQMLGAERARKMDAAPAGGGHLLARPSIDAVKKAFMRCHRVIWKSEKMSPQAAFLGFAKLLFVKLWEDRRLRDAPKTMAAITSGQPLDADSVRYSVAWIEAQERNVPHPVDTILFQQLLTQLEADIARKKRKRIFAQGESLGMSTGTVKRVVAELEHYYLFGIDEDLNGRMFEAFLSATMRGQDLGQYFTPRSIVKLMLRLGRPIASRERVDRVLDACCGTGGFLIEALTEMRQQVYANASLSDKERTKLLNEIANEAMVGVDAGRDPPLARITRINMYLHGDGGSRVYVTDGLRRDADAPNEPVEVQEEVAELCGLLSDGLRFDLVLTNPPFSMDYSNADPDESAVLAGYELAQTSDGGRRGSLRSSVMFIERYSELLKPGGRLLTVIDDSILAGEKMAFVRRFIREKFIIRAVVSLHGDAFHAKGARVKTSILYLVRRLDGESEEQPAIFVFESQAVGLDDVTSKTPPSVADAARADALAETKEIDQAFAEYLAGSQGDWLVPAARLGDRLDAKFLRPWSVKSLAAKWSAAGARAVRLETLVDPVEDATALDPTKTYTFLRVTYEGRAEAGERRRGDEVSYERVYGATAGDIVVSHIRAINGAVCVTPKSMEHSLVSPEFTVLRVRDPKKTDAMYLWTVLRSPAVIAELLSSSTGQARFRTDWERLRGQLVPALPYAQQRVIGDKYREALEHEAAIEKCRVEAAKAMAQLGMDCAEARDRVQRAKPPQ